MEVDNCSGSGEHGFTRKMSVEMVCVWTIGREASKENQTGHLVIRV